jgi:FAD/FMN-containing dehydrogenase
MRAVATSIAPLRAQVEGPVLLAGDVDMPREISGFNVALTHRPAVVVGATSVEDVEAAVRFAARHDLPVAVQATGHGQFLDACGAVLVVTRRMNDVTIDPTRRTATLGAGVRWRAVLDAAAAHGLAPLSGSASSVGAVGYMLGGGVGLLGAR